MENILITALPQLVQYSLKPCRQRLCVNWSDGRNTCSVDLVFLRCLLKTGRTIALSVESSGNSDFYFSKELSITYVFLPLGTMKKLFLLLLELNLCINV